MLGLIERFLKQGFLESTKTRQLTEKGNPHGAVISLMLTNLYLNALDQTYRSNGSSHEAIIVGVNRRVRGWGTAFEAA